MELGILIALIVVVLGAGVWFYRIRTQFDDMRDHLTPLLIFEKENLMKDYQEKGRLLDSGSSPRKQYLIDKLEAGTIGYYEARELTKILRIEERQAREIGNQDALVAILGLIALTAISSSLATKP